MVVAFPAVTLYLIVEEIKVVMVEVTTVEMSGPKAMLTRLIFSVMITVIS